MAEYTDCTTLPDGHVIGYFLGCVDYESTEVEIETESGSYFDKSFGNYLPYDKSETFDYTEPVNVLMEIIVDGEIILMSKLPVDTFVDVPIIQDLYDYIRYDDDEYGGCTASLPDFDEDMFDERLSDAVFGNDKWGRFFEDVDDRYGLVEAAAYCDPFNDGAKLLNCISEFGWSEILSYYKN